MRLLTALLVILAAPAIAQDNYEEYYDGDILVAVTYNNYLVTGTSLQEVQDDMYAKGPAGHWAYTTWYVNWTGECEIRVDVEIIMPELDESADLYDAEYAEWDRMIAALEEHEFGHVANGIGFAHDVEAGECNVDVPALQEIWNQADIDFDAATNHGVNEGATLYLQ